MAGILLLSNRDSAWVMAQDQALTRILHEFRWVLFNYLVISMICMHYSELARNTKCVAAGDKKKPRNPGLFISYSCSLLLL
jgi:hypothetical protein